MTFEFNVHFFRTLKRFQTYSNDSKSLQFIQNYINTALKYSCSLKQTFAQGNFFLEGTLIITAASLLKIVSTFCADLACL